jgi:predicted nucleic acid-binding protein
MEGIFAATERRQVLIERVSSERFTAAWDLRKRFQDKTKISFTDLLSMVIMRERGIGWVLTEDEHFIQVGTGFRRVP